MKVEYNSMFLGVLLGAVGVFTILFLLGDIETEFSVTTGEHSDKMDKNIDVRIEKTVENGQDFTNVVVKGSGDVTREDLDKEIVETEKRIFREQSKKSGKPDEIIEKMIDGRMNKFFQENILIEQSFVKNPDVSISDLLTETIAKLGENISISRFTRFQLGETAPQSESVDS